MAGGFRIQSVTIEGFKGFTTRQEIDIQGRHVFLLGQNGNGKSSIIEAIRWGLFGSTGRPNEIVANRGYPERCRVELSLIRDGEQFSLRRTLIKGVSGGSDAVLADEHGQERLIRDIMPHLDSADAGEGMHIIFASQGTPLQRQPEDLSAFERTVFRHLGLANSRSLLSQIDSSLGKQDHAEDSHGEKLTGVRQDIDKKIVELERRRGVILSASPWDSNHTPSVAESENKVRGLIAEVTGQQPNDALSGVSLDGLIDSAEDSLKTKSTRNQGVIKGELAQIEERFCSLERFQVVLNEIEDKKSKLQSAKSQLETTLQGSSFEDLRNDVNQTRAAADSASLRRRIAEDAISLVGRCQGESVPCPLCETEHSRCDLESLFQRTIADSSGVFSTLPELETRLNQAEEHQRQAQRLVKEIDEMAQRQNEARTSLYAMGMEGLVEPVSSAQIDAVMSPLIERRSSLKEQLDNQEGWFNATNARLSKLKEEGKYHQLQKELTDLQQCKNRFEEAQKAFTDLVSFGKSVRAIQRAVERYLNERLNADIPGVSDKLSQAFSALTCHQWYDRLVIAKDMLPKLELKVASSSDPHVDEHPIGVLNGQAESALALVPYFAFSQMNDAPTEVYLVLLDDPTRAFDEEHTKILIERLAHLSSNVQLIVASQETTRFRKMVPASFEPASYVIIEPTNWSYCNGPELVI